MLNIKKIMIKIVLLLLLACGSAWAQVKESRQIKDFSAISVSQGIQLQFIYGEAKSMEVSADSKELLKYINTEVNPEGELKIYIDTPRNMKRLTFKNIVVRVSNPVLESISISSSAKAILNNIVKAKTFNLFASSSSSFSGSVQADDLYLSSSSSSKVEGSFDVMNKSVLSAGSSSKINIALNTKTVEFDGGSSSSITVNGKANEASASVSSSARINAVGFQVKTLNGKASSSGKMTFDVSEKVTGRASSSGKIEFTGQAQIISAKTSSSGKIQKL